MRNSLKSKRNPEAFALASTQLAQLRGLAEQGYLDLFYYDESRFSLVSNVPRAWQAPHAPIALPATRGPGINVAGFLRHDGTSFGAYTTTQSIKSVDITLFFNDFCQQLTQPTVVVLDNASCHRSAEVSAYLAEWEEQGLRLFFLPPYSPELNRIEVLWRCCKHQWLSFAAYTCFDRLQDELRKTLNKVGNECKINFT